MGFSEAVANNVYCATNEHEDPHKFGNYFIFLSNTGIYFRSSFSEACFL